MMFKHIYYLNLPLYFTIEILILTLSLPLAPLLPPVSCSVDVDFVPIKSGLFLRTLSSLNRKYDSENALLPTPLFKEKFTVFNSQDSVTLQAKYGHLSIKKSIQINPASINIKSNSTYASGLNAFGVSAHIVDKTITHDHPFLQILFHSSQNKPKSKEFSNSYKSSITSNYTVSARTHLCLQIHVIKNKKELNSVCVLNQYKNVCIAEVSIPTDWWHKTQSDSASVFYSAYPITHKVHCSSAPLRVFGKSSPNREQPIRDHKTFFVSTFELTHRKSKYLEIKEDQHVLIYVPEKQFYSGSKIRIPIRLKPGSDLKLFVVRLKARYGIRILGAEATDPKSWRVTTNFSRKRNSAVVTAYLQDSGKIPNGIQEIFHWILEVYNTSGSKSRSHGPSEDSGRLFFNLEYELNNKLKEKYGSIQNKVITKINIQHDNVRSIVPIVKIKELFNTAVLSEQVLTYNMWIYAISQNGKITDITSQTACHSGNEHVLKVAQSCNKFYFDGTETEGSARVSIISKYGRHTRFTFLKVWFPELPLTIQLSDDKLNQIKGWRAPTKFSRRTRGIDYGLLTHPSLLLKEEEGARKESSSAQCHLRYQRSLVTVYTRFHIPDGLGKRYYIGRKAYFPITDLINKKMRIADPSIALLSKNLVEGINPGRTEVQVLSRQGRVIGAKEVKVVKGKVSIVGLIIDIITGMKMNIKPDALFPGVYTASISPVERFHKQYQEGILNIGIKFSDNTLIPLSQLSPTDYFLDMDTLNNHVVAFGPMISPDRPQVIALGQGKGELLKISLELGDKCQRKKSRPLAVSYVYVNVDFGVNLTPEPKLQQDMSHLSFSNISPRRKNSFGDSTDKTLHISVAGKNKKHQIKPRNNLLSEASALPSDGAQKVESHLSDLPNHEAQQQSVSRQHFSRRSALEICMYVLLAVFCFAVLIFSANCAVYIMRQRRQPSKNIRFLNEKKTGFFRNDVAESVSQAHDWVWIGRATLERNAINTDCSNKLVPHSDFNSIRGNNNKHVKSKLEENQSLRNYHGSSGVNAADESLASTLNSDSSVTSSTSEGHSGRRITQYNTNNSGSVSSTYKGSECSIRITSNPLNKVSGADCSTNSRESLPEKNRFTNLHSASQLEPNEEPMEDDLEIEEDADEFNELEEQDMSTDSTPVREVSTLHHSVGSDSSGRLVDCSDMEWDAMGLTYEQLMEYFDNLKESTA